MPRVATRSAVKWGKDTLIKKVVKKPVVREKAMKNKEDKQVEETPYEQLYNKMLARKRGRSTAKEINEETNKTSKAAK